MVVFDTDVLSLLLHPSARAPINPDTEGPLDAVQGRIEYLIERLESSKEQVLIPTPVLSEFLVLAGDEGPDYMAIMND